MGYIYRIEPLPKEIDALIDQEFERWGWYGITDKDWTPVENLRIHGLAHAVAARIDPMYSGAEPVTFSAKLFGLENLEGYRLFEALRQLLSDLMSFAMAKITAFTPDGRQTVLREEGLPDYDTALVPLKLKEEMQLAVETFLPRLESGNIAPADVRNIRRYGILLDCMEPHYYCDLSGREEGGVSACEQFYYATDRISDAGKAFRRALLVLYTASAYGIIRVRRECEVPPMLPEEDLCYF